MSAEGEKTINLAERMSQTVASLLGRLGISYQGNESYGKIRINGLTLKRWFQPKLASPFSGKPGELSTFQLGKGITPPTAQYPNRQSITRVKREILLAPLSKTT